MILLINKEKKKKKKDIYLMYALKIVLLYIADQTKTYEVWELVHEV
jgi:hypothetical protein